MTFENFSVAQTQSRCCQWTAASRRTARWYSLTLGFETFLHFARVSYFDGIDDTDTHEQAAGHCGVNTTLSILRQRFWIINAKTVVRRVVTACVTCKRVHPNTQI